MQNTTSDNDQTYIAAYDNSMYCDRFSKSVHVRTGALINCVCKGLNYGSGGGVAESRIFERVQRFSELIDAVEALGSCHTTNGPQTGVASKRSAVAGYADAAALRLQVGQNQPKSITLAKEFLLFDPIYMVHS